MKLEIIVRQREGEKVVSEKLIKEVEVKMAKTILDLGFRHKEQVEIIGNIQEEYIPLQASKLSNKYEKCEKCGGKTRKDGMHYSNYHSSLSLHRKKQLFLCFLSYPLSLPHLVQTINCLSTILDS